MTSKLNNIVDKLSKSATNPISPDDFISKDRLFSKHDLDVQSNYSVISKNCVFEGDIRSERNIVILGQFTGNINCANTVISMEGSIIDGNIEANNIVIYGNIRGELLAKNVVKLFPSACTYAKITGKTFIIEEGAVFDGRFDLL